MANCNIKDYSVISDDHTINTEAIQKALDNCANGGGGRVYISDGVYLTGTLYLKNNTELYIERGSGLKGSPNIEDYTEPALIFAQDTSNISIAGHGFIDGNDTSFFEKVERYHITGSPSVRPKLIMLLDCQHITIENITCQNSPFWTIHPIGCDDVLISQIRVLNNLAMQNSDGINPDHSRNVRILGCHIECADDCIALKNTRQYKDRGPCENIIINSCSLISTSSAFKIGSETASDFRNIMMSDCIITRTNRGLGLQLRDEGNIDQVIFENIIIETRRFYDRYWGKAEPIWITAYPRHKELSCGSISNIHFRGIRMTSENGIFVDGGEYSQISNIDFDDIQLIIDKKSKWEGGVYDRRPVDDQPLINAQTSGIRLRNARDIIIRNTSVQWGKNIQPYYGDALDQKSIENLNIESFCGTSAAVRHAELSSSEEGIS